VGELVGWVALGLSAVLGVLLALQSSRLGRVERQFRALMKGTTPASAGRSLGELIADHGARIEAAHADIVKLQRAADLLDASVARSIQCIGLVRYNPFQEAGGDQSFALALLDRTGNGVIISSLHGRTATRFYAKAVKDGTSALSLSDEETQALKQAMGEVKRET